MADEASDSSTDSENTGEVKNVTRLVMRPPGHSGKAKKGHLVFDASFEGGNLGKVDYVSEFEYDLYIRPDLANPRYRVWFNFTIENVRSEQRVVITIVNISKIIYLFHEGFTPVVRSTSRPKWYKIPEKHVYYYRCPYHRNNYVLSFAFAFDKEEDVYQFAFSYPYTYSRLQKYLEYLEKINMPFLTREEIGKSVQGRRLDMITIHDNKLLEEGKWSVKKKRKIVIITARVHPGETPSSFVCQGLIDFLLSDHPVAQCLRERVTFKIIPMLNPDGVFVGNYRTSLLGTDLNRCWHETSPLAHPTLHATKKLVDRLMMKKDDEVDMYLDLHAHTSLLGTFVYGSTFDDVYRFQRHTLFPKHLGNWTDDFSIQNTIYNRDPGKSGTSRRFFSNMLPSKANCYTLEVSFYGYRSKQDPSKAVTAYTEDSYIKLGENIAWALLDYYVATGYISSGAVPAGIKVGKRGLVVESSRKALNRK